MKTDNETLAQIESLTDSQKTTILTTILMVTRTISLSRKTIETMIWAYAEPDGAKVAPVEKPDGAKELDAWDMEQADDAKDNTPYYDKMNENVVVCGIGVMSRRMAIFCLANTDDTTLKEAYRKASIGPAYWG